MSMQKKDLPQILIIQVSPNIGLIGMQQILIVAPTPNTAYTVEMWYDETPERLGNGSGNKHNNFCIKQCT